MAPLSSAETEAIQIDGIDFTVCDSFGTRVTGTGDAWDEGSMVSVILNMDQQKAYIQNHAGRSLIYTATVTTSWLEEGGYYYQDIAVEGIQETDTPIVGIDPGEDNSGNVAYSVAISNVFRITTSANSIRVWARSKPSIAFPIRLKVVK